MLRKPITRRIFFFSSLAALTMAALWKFRGSTAKFLAKFDQPPRVGTLPKGHVSDVYLARNGSAQKNMARVLEMMGGIEKFIGAKDIVVLKPNAQWWNQGRTNLAAMKEFMDQVLQRPGFEGEIIVAENNHFMDETLTEPDNVRGWVKFSEINGDIDGENHNLNSLIELYQKKGFANVIKYHWRDGGPKREWWGNGQNGGIVTSPAQGDGYVWTDLDYHFKGLWGLKQWKVKMSYPVFTSRYSGITIDLMHGAYQRDGHGSGRYLSERPVKLINFAVLNHHGSGTGITSSVKNYMGITDLSCGFWGMQPEGYANVHFCGESLYPYAMAGAIGYFMKMVRMADLNIVTADWVGWGHRTDVKRAEQTRTILAGTDPIAIDYYGAKHIIYPLSKKPELHDPDNPSSSVHKFLNLALLTLRKGTTEEERIRVHEHNFGECSPRVLC